jgi:glycosyltransferase involved in cell wall biosynthesis
MIDVTILTATYNRAHTLERLARSIAGQAAGLAIEWLVIDDGSVDETEQLIARLATELPITIRYHRKENGGKHTAFNKGVALAEGQFILTVDSDDQLHPEGLGNAMAAWKSIPAEEQPKFMGVVGLCLDQSGRVMGDKFHADVLDSTPAEITFRYGVTGDKSGMHRTDVFRMFPFPERKGMTFIPEGRIWMEISNHYKTRNVNQPFVIVNLDAGGNLSILRRSDRLLGDLEYHRYMLSHQTRWLSHAPFQFIKSGLVYNHSLDQLKKYGRDLGDCRVYGPIGKLIAICTWPPSILLRSKSVKRLINF